MKISKEDFHYKLPVIIVVMQVCIASFFHYSHAERVDFHFTIIYKYKKIIKIILIKKKLIYTAI